MTLIFPIGLFTASRYRIFRLTSPFIGSQLTPFPFPLTPTLTLTFTLWHLSTRRLRREILDPVPNALGVRHLDEPEPDDEIH